MSWPAIWKAATPAGSKVVSIFRCIVEIATGRAPGSAADLARAIFPLTLEIS